MLDKRLIEFAISKDPDATLMQHLRRIGAGAVAAPRRTEGVGPLNLLLAGYLGAGNVGSDMRCNELVRQFRHLFGDNNVRFGALAVSSDFPADVLGGVEPVLFEGYVPDAVANAVDRYDGVIACEGSMFKSHFSDVLSAVMAAALGRAHSVGKLAIGYGAEVGAMNEALRDFVVEQAGGAPIFCRTTASRQAAVAIGLDGRAGADSAWSFDAATPARAEALLRDLGWDGAAPVLMICPTNPFWWPVRTSPSMALEMQRTGAHTDLCYGSIFFHADSDEIRERYRHYVRSLAVAADEIMSSSRAFTVLLPMEPVDERVCADIARALKRESPVVQVQGRRVADIVAMLRRASLLISSRFHALVGSIPALVPAIGIATDERIRLLLGDAGSIDRLIDAGDRDLAERIVAAARSIDQDGVAQSCRETVRRELRAMGEMGMAVVEEVQRKFPAFSVPDRPSHWSAHLPPLPKVVEDLIQDESYA